MYLLLVFTIVIILALAITKYTNENYVDIIKYDFNDRLKDYGETLDKDLKLNDIQDDREIIEKAETQLKKLGNYNIVQEKTNFENLNERFNDFHVNNSYGDRPEFSHSKYDDLYYLHKDE